MGETSVVGVFFWEVGGVQLENNKKRLNARGNSSFDIEGGKLKIGFKTNAKKTRDSRKEPESLSKKPRISSRAFSKSFLWAIGCFYPR